MGDRRPIETNRLISRKMLARHMVCRSNVYECARACLFWWLTFVPSRNITTRLSRKLVRSSIRRLPQNTCTSHSTSKANWPTPKGFQMCVLCSVPNMHACLLFPDANLEPQSDNNTWFFFPRFHLLASYESLGQTWHLRILFQRCNSLWSLHRVALILSNCFLSNTMRLFLLLQINKRNSQFSRTLRQVLSYYSNCVVTQLCSYFSDAFLPAIWLKKKCDPTGSWWTSVNNFF